MPEMPVVGPWAREKLDALARYLDFYSKVLKNQPWRTIYLDAYAGGGRAVVRAAESALPCGPNLFGEEMPIDTEARELIDGSPRVAFWSHTGALAAWPKSEATDVRASCKRQPATAAATKLNSSSWKYQAADPCEPGPWTVGSAVRPAPQFGQLRRSPIGIERRWKRYQQPAILIIGEGPESSRSLFHGTGDSSSQAA